MTEQDLIYISELATRVPKNGNIVELGSYHGMSSVTWALSCDPSVTIYCVDTFRYMMPPKFLGFSSSTPADFFDDFKKNTEKYENIVPIRGWCPNEIEFPKCKIDIFFNDGTHINPFDWENTEYFLQFLNPGGMICGHDYSPNWPDVMINVHRLEELFDKPVTLYDNSTLWSFEV